jgi:hypothetical protein
VEYDRGFFAAPLVLAARAHGVPTFTMVHGTIAPHGYTPLLADMALCWGSAQVEQFTELGVPPDRLVITGCSRVGLQPVDRAAARSRLGFDERPAFVLATNNQPPPVERLSLAAGFATAIARQGNEVQGHLRVHPREHISDYRAAGDRLRDISISDGDVATADEVAASADLVVCGATAFADEAVMVGTPVILYDPTGRTDTLQLGLGAEGPTARDTDELTRLLTRWRLDPQWRSELHDRTARRSEQLCAAQGNEAADRVAEVVRSARRRRT